VPGLLRDPSSASESVAKAEEKRKEEKDERSARICNSEDPGVKSIPMDAITLWKA
jgi:hypothetical protein